MAKHRYKHLHNKIIINTEKSSFSLPFMCEILKYMIINLEKSNIEHILEHFDFYKDAFFYLQNGIIQNNNKNDIEIKNLILELCIVLETKKFSFQNKDALVKRNIDIFLEYSYELQNNLYGLKNIDEKKYNDVYLTVLYNRNIILSKYLLNYFYEQLSKDKELNNFIVEIIKKYEFEIDQTEENDYHYFSIVLDHIIDVYSENISKSYLNSIFDNIYKKLIVSNKPNSIIYLEDIKNKTKKLNEKVENIYNFNNSDFNILSNVLNNPFTGFEHFYDDNIITIDPPKAENLDDAISLKIDCKGNYLVGIYITDVSSEILYGTNLDAMAFEKFQSNSKINSIIPKIFSLNKCSLLPEQERKVIACFIKFDRDGNMINYEFQKGYINIKSENRFSYDRANKILANQFFDDKSTETLKNLSSLSKKGFFSKIKHNDDYSPSELIIAKFMSMYNILAAQKINLQKIPAIYRARDYSGDININIILPPLSLLTSLDSELKFNSQSILAQPYYTIDLKTHCDKNNQHYVQVTSPLRRYFDVINQRLFSSIFDDESLNKISDPKCELSIKKYLASLVNISQEKNCVYIKKK